MGTGGKGFREFTSEATGSEVRIADTLGVLRSNFSAISFLSLRLVRLVRSLSCLEVRFAAQPWVA